jgi:hypothetical protein
VARRENLRLDGGFPLGQSAYSNNSISPINFGIETHTEYSISSQAALRAAIPPLLS